MNIFSCKLYKSSRNKDKIRAAVSDPINKELLEQAIEYLDDEYIDEEHLGEIDKDQPEPEDTAIRPSEGSPAGGGGSPDSFSEGFEPVDGEEPDNDHELSDRLAEEEENQEQEDLDLESSTKSNKQPIKASVDYIADEVNTLQGSLDSQEDTQGVARIQIKEGNELWIFYQDKINLNNVMENVISKLNALGYGMLEFNRLARTDNAIVFSINETESPVQPENSTEE